MDVHTSVRKDVLGNAIVHLALLGNATVHLALLCLVTVQKVRGKSRFAKSKLSMHVVICVRVNKESGWNSNCNRMKPDRPQHDHHVD